MHFSTIPFITYCVNDRLPQSIIKEQINTWLDFWERLFGYKISLRAEELETKCEKLRAEGGEQEQRDKINYFTATNYKSANDSD